MNRILLSPYSKLFYNEWKLNADRCDYNLVFDQELIGRIDNAKLNKAIKRFISDYIILNSHIEQDNETLYWIKNNKLEELPYFGKKLSNKEILAYVQKPFDLENGPLYRFALIKLDDNRHRFIGIIHHIALDGNNFDELLNLLSAYYNNEVYASTIKEIEQISQINNVSKNLQKNLVSNGEYYKNYWQTKLSDIEPVDLTFLSSGKKIQSKKGYVELSFSFDNKILDKLNQVKSKFKLSPYLYSHAILALLINKFTNNQNFGICIPVAIHESSGLIYGASVNTIIIPYNFSRIISISDLFTQATDFVTSLKFEKNNYNYLPVSEIIAVSNKSLLNVAFAKTNLKNSKLNFTDIDTIVNDDLNIDVSSDLLFEQEIKDKKINFRVRCKVKNMDRNLFKNFVDVYQRLFLQILEDTPEKNINDYSLLTNLQYKKIFKIWNKAEKPYPDNRTIHSLFEEQATLTPNNIAVIYKDTQLTYQQLNEKAAKLANYIKKSNYFKPDDLIALCLDRSESMIIAILAVLKTGCAYVPIDPQYPQDRIYYILKDTRTKLILTNEIHGKKLKEICSKVSDSVRNYQIDVLLIDSVNLLNSIDKHPISTPISEVTSKNLAYVIYTSGTTGAPKGVMIEHRSVVNLTRSNQDSLSLNNSSRVLQYSSLSFDASVFEIFPTLLTGGRLYIIPESLRIDPDALTDYLINSKINLVTITPAILKLFPKKNIPSLKTLIIAGEVCDSETIEYWSRNRKLINGYGPTENTVCATMSIYQKNNLHTCIGKSITNTQSYILDKNYSISPISSPGEIFIGGAGLARGYLNKPELTAERFIVNPFQTDEEKLQGKNDRLYKTGDMARWLYNGDIDYMGRNDFQVKIRGHRIELGEIENIMQSYDGIKNSVVLAKKQVNSTNKYLIGYYVADSTIDEEALYSYLELKLPDYMIPTTMMRVKVLPVTINGKLDIKALPEPVLNQQSSYVSPENDLQKQICQLWKEVLGLDGDEKVGIRDDFFRLGGDSISSIQLVSRLRQKLNLKVSVKDIFNYKTIERLYENVIIKSIHLEQQVTLKTEQGLLSGSLPLLPIQEWFFESCFADKNHWNQSFLIKVPELNTDRLQACIAELINHHDAFRLRYKQSPGNVYSQYYDNTIDTPKLNMLDVSTLDGEDFDNKLQNVLTLWQSNFDFQAGPSFNIGYLFGYKDGSARIYFSMHHLIVDAVSWRILIEDLGALYEGKKLGVKGTSYRQWVEAVKQYAQRNTTEKSYWDEVVPDKLTHHTLNDLMESDKSNNISKIKLNTVQTKKLLQKSNIAYNTTINDILLTALAYALVDITGSKINHIVLEGHGREDIDSEIDITRTLGWFTTMFPVKLEVYDDLHSSIQSIKEMMRHIPNKGIGYGALKGYKDDELPRISFNYLGQFDQVKQSEGFCISEEASGSSIAPENVDRNIVNINGLIINGSLEFHITSKLSASKTSQLAESFKHNLEEVIEHTVKQTRKYLTVSDISKVISKKYLDAIQKEKEIENIYLANSLQQGFIYHSLRQGNIDDAYLVQIIWEYHSSIDQSRLKKAWMLAQNRYPSLRLRFAWEEELVQIIDKESQVDWRYIDLSKESLEYQAAKIQQIQADDRQEPYNLQTSGLFRVYLIKQHENLYTCIFSNHHAILDGWSNPVLLSYVHDVYVKLEVGDKIEQSIDHSYNQSQQYIQSSGNLNKKYWIEYMSNFEEKVELSGLLLLSARHVNLNKYNHILEPKNQSIAIKNEKYEKLCSLSKDHGVTLNAILQYVWHKSLSIYGNNNQTIVGMTVSGRNLPIDNIEHSVGLYINTLPLFVNHKEQTILEAIKGIQDDVNELNSRSNVNLAELQKNGDRVFDSIFIFENYPSSTTNNLGLKVASKQLFEKLDYPLCVSIHENNDQLRFNLEYAGELFDQSLIKDLLSIVERLLQQIIENPRNKVSKLYYLDSTYNFNVVEENGQAIKICSDDNTIHSLFEKQVALVPNKVAVIYEDKQLTYKQLNERANQLAHYLNKTANIQPDTLIALCLDRSEQMLIAILAVLKSGGAYVPIDPNYPEDRINYILEDTNAKLILTNDVYKEKLININLSNLASNEDCNLRVLSIDTEIFLQQIATLSSSNLISDVTCTNLAYVIYTSGTTGKAKGVMIEHKGVVNLNYDLTNRYELNNSDSKEVILQFSNYVFDASVEQMILAILNGNILLLIKNGLWADKNEFYKVLNANKVTHIDATPSFLKQYDFSNVPSLKRIIFGGEAFTKDCYKTVADKNIKIVNEYGPTETSIVSLVNDVEKDIITIGKPIANTSCYVIDKNLMLLPIGAIGELYIGGIGLARGYLNQSELTANNFINNPFQTSEEKKLQKNEKLYKTGDLVRRLSDGDFEYIGRNDSQVKIRGYRIELGEVENVIQSYDPIKQSVVVLKSLGNSTNNHLIGYYVTDLVLNNDDIRSYLKTKLPDYMIPTALVKIDSIPLTINGKIDIQALPVPELNQQENYASPRNELESRICQIWSEVLELPFDKIGVNADFFRLGGNSILAITLANKLVKDLNLNISVSTIFKCSTVSRLVHYIKTNSEGLIVIPKALINSVEDNVLSFAQERLWFIEKYEGGTNAYNIPMVFKLADHTKLDILEKSIRDLVSRHQILRTIIKEDNKGNSYQLTLNDKQYPLEITKIKLKNQLQLSKELKNRENMIFDLNNQYPINICIFECDDSVNRAVCYLSIVIHHIAFDGWSYGIFIKELKKLYDYYFNLSQGLDVSFNLSDLALQYSDFAIWQKGYLTNDRLDAQLSYWKNKLSYYEQLNLITDKVRPDEINYNGADIHFEIDEITSKRLRTLAKELKVSLFSLLLSGYYLMLKAYSNQNNIVIGTPVSNRHYNQLENIIGFFVNSLVLKIEIETEEDTQLFIKRVGKEIIEAQIHQDLPFEKLVDELKIVKDPSRHPIFQVIFGFQNFGDNNSNQHTEKSENILQKYSENSGCSVAKFDLSTFIDDSSDKITGIFNYSTSLYNKRTIINFITTYKNILNQLVNNVSDKKNTKIADINLLTSSQYDRVVKKWNNTREYYSDDQTLHSLFIQKACEQSNAIAVIDDGHSALYTYNELLSDTQLIAKYLINIIKAKQSGSSALISVLSEKGYNQIVSTLAILQSGNAYLPLNIEWPINRIDEILSQGQVEILLVSKNQLNNQELTKLTGNYTIIVIEDLLFQCRNDSFNQLSQAPLPAVQSDQIAYVIFTSGSTGKPKGVTISHSGAVNTLYAINHRFNVTSQDKVLALSELSFDLSVYDFFGVLAAGGTIVIPKQDRVKDPKYWLDLINKYQITIWNTVPQLGNLLVDENQNCNTSSQSLRLFLLSGDWIPLNLSEKIKALYPQAIVMSLGGATEGSIWSIWYEINVISPEWSSIPYGTAMPNQQIYVLDQTAQPVPEKVAGEIYIGGVGVALNYFRDEDKTASSFIEHPTFGRIYKTGDLGRWNSQGYIEFIGRIDNQIKVNGYRVELDEISSKLIKLYSLDNVISTIVTNSHADHIVCYYTGLKKLELTEVEQRLNDHLPCYMIPKSLIHVDKFPLTVNGKLDTKALPVPDLSKRNEYVAPNNQIEIQLCDLWSSILEIPTEQIGIRDNFFKLGGSSILAIKLISLINKKFNSNTQISVFFKESTVSGLSKELGSSIQNNIPEKQQDEVWRF